MRRAGLALALALGLTVGGLTSARAARAEPDAPVFRDPAATVLPAIADASIDSRATGENYGGAERLWVSRGQQMTFLRFATAPHDGAYVRQAKLRFFASGRQGPQTQWPLQVYGTTGRAWSEHEVTWDESPRSGGEWLEMVDGSDYDGIDGQGWYEADVTPYVNEHLASGRPIEFRVESEAGKFQQLAFSSREAAANPPELVLFGDRDTRAADVPRLGAGEDGSKLWLRYPKADGATLAHLRERARAVVLDEPGPVLRAAADELRRGFSGLTGRTVGAGQTATEGSVLVGTVDGSPLVRDLLRHAGLLDRARRRGGEGFVLASVTRGRDRLVVVGSAGAQGAQYGAFRLLQMAQLGTHLGRLRVSDAPRVRHRMNDHWANYASNTANDGWNMIERGYAGHSLWLPDRPAAEMTARYVDYARANASVGINGTVLNSVNATREWLEEANLPRVAAIADALRPYGVRVHLSVRFDSPMQLGGLTTADPLDPAVREWWHGKIDSIYRHIPDFGGFLVKGDSEGEPGPLQYGRTHADGANMLAEPLKRHGGIVMWRAFVYGPALGELDPDRAKQAYQLFKPLDGEFAGNVILQTKNGVWDFQPREPVTPLLGGMPRTNTGIELPLMKEYTGHSTHADYQVAEFERILKSDTRAAGAATPVHRVIDGGAFGYSHTLMAGVSGTGTDANWTRHPLDQANWYGFGRLAWDPTRSAAKIAEDWAGLTFTRDGRAQATIAELLMDSEEAFARYAQPLGLPFTVALRFHFKNDVPAHDGTNGADSAGVGFDRSRATGSGFSGLYPAPIADRYERVATTPERLLLFLHHVPYTEVLPHSGETVIQRIYDLTFDGVTRVDALIRKWDAVRHVVDDRRWRAVRSLLERQRSEAINYRNVTNRHFFGLSGIGDRRRPGALDAPTASVPAQTVAPGGRVAQATGNERGRVYLVPANWAGTGRWEREARLRLAADRLTGTWAAVPRAGAVVRLDAPARPGAYRLYAVDEYGNVSAPTTGTVTVTGTART